MCLTGTSFLDVSGLLAIYICMIHALLVLRLLLPGSAGAASMDTQRNKNTSLEKEATTPQTSGEHWKPCSLAAARCLASRQTCRQ